MGFCDRISGKSSVCYGSCVTLLLLLLLDRYGALGLGTQALSQSLNRHVLLCSVLDRT
jgi:hypothetical protein